ncbi:TIR domain-containing protein [uncultured Sphingomonas sp.]|uniref:TIR domain-containing protein n=1 Tax=uncultured Sphingomonas sp. TaxID=158754 RepID=UPI0025DAA895|nr:TIR domain-containing protein [uncultured Sphingomonas sp.]
MGLPIRTTIADVDALCSYLVTKPTGATLPEAKAVLDSKILDGRKISALKVWGLLDDTSGKMLITDRGRLIGKDKGVRRVEGLREAVASIPPYRAIVERAVHRSELSLSAVDVAAHWHQHFKADASESDKTLNDQAVCFFQLAEGADLGKMVVGRRGQSTRFEFDAANARSLAEGGVPSVLHGEPVEDEESEYPRYASDQEKLAVPTGIFHRVESSAERGNRVFITHGKNKKILEQVKELVAFGKFEPIVAQEREAAAKPVPEKVMDEMRSCQAAVIHVGSEGFLLDSSGNQVPQINGNVLIEIGAAMALYARNFILLVEEGVTLPSNLQGLYECRYSGDELNMSATMKLLKAFNEFK